MRQRRTAHLNKLGIRIKLQRVSHALQRLLVLLQLLGKLCFCCFELARGHAV